MLLVFEPFRFINAFIHLYPNVANVGGLQSQGVEGEVVVLYFEPLTRQNLKSSGVPDVLGRSSKSEDQRATKGFISRRHNYL